MKPVRQRTPHMHTHTHALTVISQRSHMCMLHIWTAPWTHTTTCHKKLLFRLMLRNETCGIRTINLNGDNENRRSVRFDSVQVDSIVFLLSLRAYSPCVHSKTRSKSWSAATPFACAIVSIVDRWLIYENVQISCCLEFESKAFNTFAYWNKEKTTQSSLQQLNKEPAKRQEWQCNIDGVLATCLPLDFRSKLKLFENEFQ